MFDVAIQYFGNADYAMDIAYVNDMGVTDDLTPGGPLILPDIELNQADQKVVNYFDSAIIKPSSNTL